jgi:DNA polymerase III sliding clamp (beta) subunit (PCNA family)
MGNAVHEIEFKRPQAFAMAHACIATKADPRAYLHYLLLDLETRTLVGTDGHRLVEARDAFDQEFHGEGHRCEAAGRYLIRPAKAVPTKTQRLTLDLEAGTLTAMSSRRVLTTIPVEITDEQHIGNFPKYQRVLPDIGKEQVAVEEIGLDFSQVFPVLKAAGTPIGKMIFCGDQRSVVVVPADEGLHESVTFIVMPMRM